MDAVSGVNKTFGENKTQGAAPAPDAEAAKSKALDNVSEGMGAAETSGIGQADQACTNGGGSQREGAVGAAAQTATRTAETGL